MPAQQCHRIHYEIHGLLANYKEPAAIAEKGDTPRRAYLL